MSVAHRFTQFLRRVEDDDGSMTVYGLSLVVALAMVGGYAIDVSNVMTDRTQLQNTADAAAHAAILTREFGTAEAAKAKAVEIAEENMSEQTFGEVLDGVDVVFGSWNSTTRSFVPDSTSRDAVQVTLRQTEANANPVETYLLDLVGFNKWNVSVSSTFLAYNSSCFNEGFVADDVVDIQSNNAFYNGFCIHSNEYVSLNSNNFFEPGTVVSMPDLADLDIPNSGFQTNTGLREALRVGSYNIRVLQRIDDIIAMVDEPGSVYYPDYISGASKTITKSKITSSDLTSGRVHYWTCPGSGKGTIEGGTVVQNVVIVSTCEITFASGVKVENSVIATTNTSDRSFDSPSGFILGKNDNCAVGGGAQLVTLGGMRFPANLEVYGSQLLALKDINFAARANGMQGTAMVAGGTISGTSNMSMGLCETGMEDNFESKYFRMVN